MKRKNRNNFGKRKLDDSRGEFIIPSGPVKRGIENLKSKYFAENSYDNSFPSAMSMDDYSIPVKKMNNNKTINSNNNPKFNNNSIPQSFYSNQFTNPIGMPNQQNNNINQNPHFSAEYKINYNPNQQNNISNNNQAGFNNMISFGNYNPMGMSSMPPVNNVTNYIRPMGINPFAPPTFANNPNLNFGLSHNFGNNNNTIFHSNHNLFNNSNQNENNNNSNE